ncbi:MAG: alpha-amylase family glycosyl hydrolase, partial [Cyanobacteria bacterium P01_F01_bin.3]
GTMADFDQLLAAAKARTIKVIIDQVWGHTSDEHAWFLESKQSKNNAKADWYVWADPKPDGTPPNNWLSYFGGSAWEWSAQRKQYYLHHYLAGQPALNLHNVAVKEALLKTAKFWLDKGVNGFRLDAIFQTIADPQLRDNPVRPTSIPLPVDVAATNPITMQLREYSSNHPDILAWLEDVRSLTDQYPNTVLLAETGGDDPDLIASTYTQGGNRCHLAYSFSLLNTQFSTHYLHTTLTRIEEILKDGWFCFAFSNHDVARVNNRWRPSTTEPDADFARLTMLLGLTIRGAYCLYQGEELGLPEGDVPFEDFQDPYGIEYYPEFKGRDGCRTPFPWNSAAPQGGFTTAIKPWLPMMEKQVALAAKQQETNEASVLHSFRDCLSWRKSQKAITTGSFQALPVQGNCLAYLRACETQTLLFVFNLGQEETMYSTSGLIESNLNLLTEACQNIASAEQNIKLGKYGYGVFELS